MSTHAARLILATAILAVAAPGLVAAPASAAEADQRSPVRHCPGATRNWELGPAMAASQLGTVYVYLQVHRNPGQRACVVMQPNVNHKVVGRIKVPTKCQGSGTQCRNPHIKKVRIRQKPWVLMSGWRQPGDHSACINGDFDPRRNRTRAWDFRQLCFSTVRD
jgi:hypothetical protein